MSTDFYELLRVDRGVGQDALKKAYRKRARELHPDANPNDPAAEEQFKEVSRAYEVLSDPETRARYDRFGEQGISGAASSGDQFGGGLGDIFEAFFSGSPFGGQSRGRTGPPRGQDLEITVDVQLEQVVSGATIPVDVRTAVACEECAGSGAGSGTQPVTCSDCGGAGQVRQRRNSLLGQMITTAACGRCSGFGQVVMTPCAACKGDGRVITTATYTIDVPEGVDTGTTLRLTGRGAVGPRGGSAGDLYVHMRVATHAEFDREGDDLVTAVDLSVAQATLGTHKVLHTFDGDIDLVVPSGTQHGHEFVSRGKGVPHLQGRGRGNLVVRIFINVPVDLSDKEEELFRELAKLRGEDVASQDKSLFSKIKSAFS